VHHSFFFFVVIDVVHEVLSYMSGSGSSYETILPTQNVMVKLCNKYHLSVTATLIFCWINDNMLAFILQIHMQCVVFFRISYNAVFLCHLYISNA
jgi:hypothetical protein